MQGLPYSKATHDLHPSPAEDRSSPPLPIPGIARRLLLIMVLLFCAVPGHVGPQSTLTVPVYFARIELEERTPTLLNLGLPGGEYEVSPSSLGYFTEDMRFVYTSDVPRGLIYGMLGDKPVVFELSGPGEAPLYFEEHLELIRQRVVKLNECRNLLKIERESFRSNCKALGIDEKRLRTELAPESAELPSEAWVGELAANASVSSSKLSGAITDEARHNAELKRLYYNTQLARLELILSEFDLQIAMARVPRPDIEQLVSLGNDEQVKETMLAEISRLRSAWQERLELLSRTQATTQRLLIGLDPVENPLLFSSELEDAERLSFQTGIPTLPAPGSVELYDQLPPEHSLRLGLLQARLLITDSELEMLRASMESLESAEKHVRSGGVPDWANLPTIAFDATKLELARTDTLGNAQLVELSTATLGSAADMMLALAVSFSGSRTRVGAQDESEARPALDPDTREVEYGLLAVDYALRPDAADQLQGPMPASAPELMIDRLKSMAEDPHLYGAGGHDLGYLRFLAWYGELVGGAYGLVSDYSGGWSTRSYGL